MVKFNNQLKPCKVVLNRLEISSNVNLINDSNNRSNQVFENIISNHAEQIRPCKVVVNKLNNNFDHNDFQDSIYSQNLSPNESISEPPARNSRYINGKKITIQKPTESVITNNTSDIRISHNNTDVNNLSFGIRDESLSSIKRLPINTGELKSIYKNILSVDPNGVPIKIENNESDNYVNQIEVSSIYSYLKSISNIIDTVKPSNISSRTNRLSLNFFKEFKFLK